LAQRATDTNSDGRLWPGKWYLLAGDRLKPLQIADEVLVIGAVTLEEMLPRVEIG
jgi:hypothetical protein